VSPGSAQFGLRASIRNATNFSSGGLNFSNNNSNLYSNNSSTTNSVNDSMKGSPVLSPKVGGK